MGAVCHTYSIVARDAENDQLGVAVQSHTLAVGRVVAWAEAGVGAVATQAVADPSFGPLGLGLMRGGMPATEALKGLLEAGDTPEWRQAGLVDARGEVAAHTGSRCIAAAGHRVGSNYAAQANMMRNETVWTAMGPAFEASDGDLAERLMAALEAAQQAGGDLRGMQSAAMLVVAGPATTRPWDGVLYDLRVDDHARPLSELRRLLAKARAIHQLRHAVELLGQPGPSAERVAQARQAFADLGHQARDNPELEFWYAVGLAGAGLVDEALPHFGGVFQADPRWRELANRLPASGRLPDDPALMTRILAASP
jgi:uncharacterized Ntn-hydrolase superfamily protein